MARASRSQFALSSGATATIWPSSTMPLREVVLLQRGVGLAAQLRQRLADLAGVGLDLGFELDRGFGEIVALEGLVGGEGGRRAKERRKGDERGNEACADGREHGLKSSSPSPARDISEGATSVSRIPNLVEVVTGRAGGVLRPGAGCLSD